MPICQQIHDEIQQISQEINIDPENLDPKEYSKAEEKIKKGVEKLQCLKVILGLKQKDISEIDTILSTIAIESGVSLFDTIATSEEAICETTMIYVGRLNFKKYEKATNGMTKLPGTLRYIFGYFHVRETNITELDLEYVQYETEIFDAANLETIKIGTTGSINIQHCPQLAKVVVKNVSENDACIGNNEILETVEIDYVHFTARIEENLNLRKLKCLDATAIDLENHPILTVLQINHLNQDLRIFNSPNLSIKNITSSNGNQILVKGRLSVLGQFSDDIQEKSIRSKFEVKGELSINPNYTPLNLFN